MRDAKIEIRYLFRYRDLIAQTLEEHKKSIAAHGACWWGWWKRPFEPPRLEVWTELEQNLTDGPVWVGLFNSGTDTTYLAKVDKVIKPKIDPAGNCEQLSPPSGDETLVPEYYRVSPFSRAWLHIVEINGELPIFGRGRYCYTKAPPLPNFEESDLDRHLKGKLISDGPELRAMDTTIWEVAPAGEDAREERVFTFSAHTHGPMTAEPIPLRCNSILHITDLHFALGKHRAQHAWALDSEAGAKTTLADAIHSSLRKEKVDIGAVIVTGDLTFIGSDDEFDAAFKFLNSLLGKFDLGRQHLVIVPGNHDIRWSTDTKYKETNVVNVAPEEAKEGYKQFYSKMFRHNADDGLGMARRYVLPNGSVVEIAALNSSSLGTGKKFLAGMGRIDEHTFTNVAAVLGWRPGESSRALRILALHHHLTPTENIELADGYMKGFGMALDGPRVQRMAAAHGVQLALHGHKHRAFLWRSGVFELPEDQKAGYCGEISILGGGSAGSTERPNNRNYFSVLTMTPSALDLDIYQATGQTGLQPTGAFGKMGTWKAETRVQPLGFMTLGPWEEHKKKGE